MIPKTLTEFELLLQGLHAAKHGVAVSAAIRNVFELLNALEDEELIKTVRSCRPECSGELN